MMRMHSKRLWALLTACIMIFGLLAFPVSADDAADIAESLAGIELGLTDPVSEDFDLPAEDAAKGVKYSWSSADSSVIVAGGRAYVLPDVGEKTVNLTVTATKNAAADSRTIPVTIAPYEYTGAYVINETFDGALDPEVWKKDANAITDVTDGGAVKNFMGTAAEVDAPAEGYAPENKVYKIIRNDNSGDNAAKKAFVHINQAVPANTRLIYQTRLRVEQQTMKGDAAAYGNYWICRDAGNAIGKYSAFIQGNPGGDNGIVMQSPADGSQKVTVPSQIKKWRTMTFDVSTTEQAAGTFDFYVDGQLEAKAFKMRDKADGLKHTAWGLEAGQTGEYWMDDYQIYAYPETAAELLEGETLGVADFGAVESNLTLPVLDGATVVWASDKPELVAADGTVDQSKVSGASEDVAFYAIVDNCGVKTAKKFDLTVPGLGGDVTDVTESLAGIELGLTEPVSEDFDLPAEDAAKGVKYSWSSADSSVIVAGGRAYVLPDVGEKTVNLTVTATKNAAADSRTIPVTIAPYEYTGAYVINETFDGALDSEVWKKDANAITDVTDGSVVKNFMGTAAEVDASAEGYDPENKVYKIIRNDNSGDNAAKKAFVHINQAVPANTRLIYQTRLRVEQQTMKGDAAAYGNYWICRDAGNAIGKYSAFIQGNPGGDNGIVMQSPADGSQKVTVPSQIKKWRTMTFDVSTTDQAAGTFDFYVDGQLEAKAFKMRDKADGLKHTAWGLEAGQTGEYWMDDYQIYAYPETAAELLEGETLGVADFGAVENNLTLPVLDGTTVVWASDKPELVAADGTVDQSKVSGASEDVAFYAIVDNCGVKTAKKFELTVNAPAEEPSSLERLNINEIIGSQPADALVSGFDLPQVTDTNANITWQSGNAAALEIQDNRRAVIKPAAEPQAVLLTAAAVENGKQNTRSFPLTVAARDDSMENELDIQSIVGQELTAVTRDFALPDTSRSGYPVEWSSSGLSSLFVHAGKAYVLRQPENQTVTLTASITKDGAATQLGYQLTIEKVAEVTSYLVNEDFEQIADGRLPQKTVLNEWGADATVVDSNQNIKIGVEQEADGIENRVAKIKHIQKDGVQNAMLHLNFTGPKKGSIVVEYRYKFISSDNGNPNIWVSGTYGFNAAPSGNFVKFPFNDEFVVAQAGNNRNTRVSYPGGQWHTLRAVINLNQLNFDMFLDGEKKCTKEPALETTGFMRMQMGFDRNTPGEIWIDDMKVYVDPVSVAENYADSIDLGDLSEVVKNLELPETTPLGGAEIMWVSSNPAVVSETGRVTNPTEGDDIPVTLWALVDNEGFRTLKTFQVNVARIKSDEESVAADTEALNLVTGGLCLEDKLRLPTVGANGSVITWTSDYPDIIAADGTVSRRPYDEERITNVTLTATVSKNSAEAKTKQFVYHVPERNYILNATVTGSSSRGDKRFAFLMDNDPSTSWAPAEGDKKKIVEVTLAKEETVNLIKVNGTCGSVAVSFMTKDSSSFTRLGEGQSQQFLPKKVKALRFEFTGENTEISSIGIYLQLTDQLVVETDMETLDLGNLNAVTQNIAIPAKGTLGSDIAAVSSDHQYLSDTGEVTRPTGGSDANVTLTLTFRKGDEARTKAYPVRILRQAGGGGGGGITGGGGNIGGGGSGGGAMVVPPVTVPTPDPKPTDAFGDIAQIAWAKDAINEFARRGYINGNENGEFEPDRMITREEFLKLVMEAFDLTTDAQLHEFADIPQDHWSAQYVGAGAALGIVNGIGDGAFGLGQPVTRCDMAVMLSKAAAAAGTQLPAADAPSFTDVEQIPQYASQSVAELSAAGIINGFDDGSFRPLEPASRAQAVVMLNHYLNRK